MMESYTEVHNSTSSYAAVHLDEHCRIASWITSCSIHKSLLSCLIGSSRVRRPAVYISESSGTMIKSS